MPRHLFALFASILVSLAVMGAEAPAADEAKAIAVKLTDAGAALFDARDAQGLAQTYAEDARLEIISRDKDTGELKTETKVGRGEIQAYYEGHFKSDDPIHARNTVEHARLLDPDLLAIGGVFEPNTEAANPMKLPFLQIRNRQDGQWRIVHLQLFILLK